MATLPVPSGTVTDDAPRRSACGRVPAPSREESNDGLIRGKATSRALNQVRDAAARRKGEMANIVDPSPDVSAEDIPCIDVTGDTPEDTAEDSNCFDDAAFLVDVEDPDAPEWPDALTSNERDKWLEGAKVELDGLREMKVYELIPHRETSPQIAASFVANLYAA
jgi:hypothetical protein